MKRAKKTDGLMAELKANIGNDQIFRKMLSLPLLPANADCINDAFAVLQADVAFVLRGSMDQTRKSGLDQGF